MTDPEDFLSRWSRRKRDARTDSDARTNIKDDAAAADRPQDDRLDATGATEPVASPPQQTRADARDAKPDDAFDLSKLPSLDSIGPATDIRMFLQPGVPEALSRAALRRAWSADPGIRDFIGLSENSWDFTASDGMHGFGALDPADAKRLLAQLFGESEPKADGDAQVTSAHDAITDAEASQNQASALDLASDTKVEASRGAADVQGQPGEGEMLQSSNPEPVSVALQQKSAEPARDSAPTPALEPLPMPRSHGRALPQ